MYRDPRYARAGRLAQEQYRDLLGARIERDRLAQATPSAAAISAIPPPAATRSPPIVFAPPTAAELEFERVRKEACARIDAERTKRRGEEAAARMILDAYAAFEPADRAPARGSDAEEAAADLILSFMPNRRS